MVSFFLCVNFLLFRIRKNCTSQFSKEITSKNKNKNFSVFHCKSGIAIILCREAHLNLLLKKIKGKIFYSAVQHTSSTDLSNPNSSSIFKTIFLQTQYYTGWVKKNRDYRCFGQVFQFCFDRIFGHKKNFKINLEHFGKCLFYCFPKVHENLSKIEWDITKNPQKFQGASISF